MKKILSAFILAAFSVGCNSDEIPQAHKGRMFDKTGALVFYLGGQGFNGPILGPGTYFTGLYDTIYMVDCSQQTSKESLTALTKDGVQFSLDIYVRYSANCSDSTAVENLMNNLSPAPVKTDQGIKQTHTIGTEQLYNRTAV